MDSLIQLLTADSVSHSIFVLGCVIALGLAVGSVRILGVSLGVAGVLFSGLLFGHYKITLAPEALEFARDMGLVIFVFMVGMQVGPGFFDSFKKDGLLLNMLAMIVVLGGAVIAVMLVLIGHVPAAAAIGLLTGATTNTPSLAAAQQALKIVPNVPPEILTLPALGYALAYPFGVLGIIASVVFVRLIFRVQISKEADEFRRVEQKQTTKLVVSNFKIENHNLHDIPLKKIPALNEMGVTISRVMHGGTVEVALRSTKIHVGDVVLAIGPEEKLQELEMILGRRSEIDLRDVKSGIESRRMWVTRPEVVGKTIAELDVRNRYGVTVSRIIRGEVDFVASGDIKLHFGDALIAVGEEDSIKKLASDLGDSLKRLNYPDLIPIFVGIILGVMLGSWSFHLPGMAAPVKLGLAGGPLIVSIILSRLGRIGPLVWHFPPNANFTLREIGISLFLACVGLRSGGEFLRVLTDRQGLYWMGGAMLITFIPLLIVSLIARLKYKMNFFTLAGLLSGSMTDPPALAFATRMADINAPAVSYAHVYPLVMILRVISVQILVSFFYH